MRAAIGTVCWESSASPSHQRRSPLFSRDRAYLRMYFIFPSSASLLNSSYVVPSVAKSVLVSAVTSTSKRGTCDVRTWTMQSSYRANRTSGVPPTFPYTT